VIPVTGLSLHKPSPLWPPPPNDISNRVHSGLRKNITDVLHRRSKSRSTGTPQAARPIDPDNVVPKILPTELGPINVGSTASLPLPGVLDADQTISLHTADGTNIEVTQQIQLYAPNGLLKHPLVSPAFSYLGGLPPLLFIAGEREVLRDEIIYTCVHFEHLVNGGLSLSSS
jgi:acetyl esterase/lipase